MIKSYFKFLMLFIIWGYGLNALAQESTCAEAVSITAGAYTGDGPSDGEAASQECFFDAMNADWYVYTPTDNLEVVISSSEDLDEPDTRVSIFTGTCNNLDCLASNDDGGDGFTSLVTFDVVGGTTYFIQWDDRWSEEEYDWTLTEIALPENIPFCPILTSPENGATEVVIDVTNNNIVTFSWVNATAGDLAEENNLFFGVDPASLFDLGVIGDDTEIISVNNLAPLTTYFWSIVPSNSVGAATGCDIFSFTTQDLTVDCPELGLNFDDGCDDGNPNTTGDIITSNCECMGNSSAGNELCEGAFEIGEGVFIDAGASAGGGASNECLFGALNASWYAYTASVSGEVTIRSGINIGLTDTRLSVHTSCENLDCIVSNDDEFPGSLTSLVTFDAIGGTTYLIEWDSRWFEGEFDFEISLEMIGGGIGCTDASACNFDLTATDDNGTCVFAVGCDTCSGEIDGSGVVINNPEIGEDCNDGDPTTENDVLVDCNGTCIGESIIIADNALCVDAIEIGEGIVNGADISGGQGASNSCFSEEPTGNSIWYAYTPSADGTATVSSSIDEDEPDTRLSIHTACNDLDCLASDDDSGNGFTSIASFNVVAGTTYIIEWDERWSSNAFDFEITLDTFLSGCTDDEACNYNVLAITDDGSCVFAVGCDTCSGETDGTGVVIDNSEVGESCDDGDSMTVNDLIQSDCSCQGMFDSGSCPTDLNNDGTTDGGDFEIFLGNFNIDCEVPCPTDFNNDGTTDGGDFEIFLGNFGFICGNEFCIADLDGSGMVDGGDFEIFLGNFSFDCE